MDEAICEWAIESRSPDETLELARRLGATLQGGEVVALEGDLGSGKTTFTKGLCLGLGVTDSRLVSSPTYVLEHVYEGRLRIHHYDAYRLQGSEELVGLGFRDHLSPESVLVIEWADRVLDALPVGCLRVDLSATHAESSGGGNGPSLRRRVRFFGPSASWAERLQKISAGKG